MVVLVAIATKFHMNSFQVDPNVKQDSSPEVLGFSLNIAIETLSEIDKLGKSFLSELGVDSFDPSLFYPYEFRLKFFKEIHDRFGSPGLFMLGA